MKKILCFDMDGTLADFYADDAYLDKMFDYGYFRNLKPLQLATDLAKDKQAKWNDIYIVSACISSLWCENEKIAWLKQHLPQIDESHFIFTKTGENKAKAVEQKIGQDHKAKFYLIDDYSVNLNDWEENAENFIGIKFLNGINSGRKLTYTYKVKNYKELKQVLRG